MYDYEEYINYDSSYDSDGAWLVNLYDGTEEVWQPTTCWKCKQLKKEVKRLQQLVELLQLPNDFE